MLGLGFDRDRLGSGRLHPVGQLEAFDPRRQLGLGGELLVVELVELLDQVELGPLLAGRPSRGDDRGCRSVSPLECRWVPW